MILFSSGICMYAYKVLEDSGFILAPSPVASNTVNSEAVSDWCCLQ